MLLTLVMYLAYHREWVLAIFVAIIGIKALSTIGRWLGNWMAS